MCGRSVLPTHRSLSHPSPVLTDDTPRTVSVHPVVNVLSNACMHAGRLHARRILVQAYRQPLMSERWLIRRSALGKSVNASKASRTKQRGTHGPCITLRV